jgi:hypothetical protein
LLERAKSQYVNIEPELPEFSERRKLLKISRNCTKKQLERFFQIDTSSQSFVQFLDTTSTKPTKA